jgi:methyl-accepting chemotaxis protein-1 (serine sensor receptor)
MLKNITIRARLAFVLGLLALIILIIGIMGIMSLHQANDALRTVYEDRVIALGQLDQVIRAVANNQLVLAKSINNDPTLLAEAISSVEKNRLIANQQWEAYVSTYLTPDEKVLANQFAQARTRFLTEGLEPALSAARNKDMKRLTELVQGQFGQHYQILSSTLDKLITLQLAVSKQEYGNSQQVYRQFRWLSVFAIVFGLGVAIVIGIWLVQSISRPLDYVIKIAQTVAAGDLTQSVMVTTTNETGKLLQAMKDMNDSLLHVVGEVHTSTDAIAMASSQIASGNLDLSSRTEEQASSLEETASSIEQLSGAVKQNSANALQANQLAIAASDFAQKGGAVVSQVITTMGSINESSRKIVDIISVIDGIAFQTNILALNAAVEAARAGEQGRGFAVVAAEVRNLAQRSASAAKEIKTLINDSVEKVKAGSGLVDEAGATMHDVVESVKRVSNVIGEISAASNEQTAGIGQVSQAIGQIDAVTQQNAALVEEAAAAATALQHQAAHLKQVVDIFKTDNASAKAAQRKTVPQLSFG